MGIGVFKLITVVRPDSKAASIRGPACCNAGSSSSNAQEIQTDPLNAHSPN